MDLSESNKFVDSKSLKDENRIHNDLKFVYIAVYVYFISEFLADEAFTLYTVIDGFFNWKSIPELFNYENFVTIFSFIFLYLASKSRKYDSIYAKRNYLTSMVVIILSLNYFLKFFFVERLVSLQSIGVDSLPTSFSMLLPFDWLNLSFNISAFTEYNSNYGRAEFILTICSAFAIFAALFILAQLVKSQSVKIQLRDSLLEYKSALIGMKKHKRNFLVLLMIAFVLLGIQNIQKSDYETVTMETEFIQQDMEKFQVELIKANDNIFESDKIEERKKAASKAYGEIIDKDKRLQNFGLSLWSSNLKELRYGVYELTLLWKKTLKEMSLKGYVEPEVIFDLNQKYKEVSELGVRSAPGLAREFTIDFWRKDFKALVK